MSEITQQTIALWILLTLLLLIPWVLDWRRRPTEHARPAKA